MKIIIMQLDEKKRYRLLYTNSFVDGMDQFWMMRKLFCDRSVYENALLGIDNFALGSFDGLSFEEGYEYEDFYMALIDTSLYDVYTIEYEGRDAVDLNRIPKLKFTKENFDHVLKMIVFLQDINPKYVMITQTDKGWIDLWGKQELSEEEKQMIEKVK